MLLALVPLLSACAPPARCLAQPAPEEQGPRCEEEEGGRLRCAYEEATCEVGPERRALRWQLPEGPPPAQGWPLVLLFQGSTQPTAWSASADDAWGALHQVRLTQALLARGFAVAAPEAALDGRGWWQTNVPPWSAAWERSADHALMLALFEVIDQGDLGPLSPAELYAAGISSGGYMTSRMAQAYPGHFQALAIQSAGWASCAGVACVLPEDLPVDHPPTLFLHGAQDVVVPPAPMQAYADRLGEQGVEVAVELDPQAGHEWLAVAPEAVPDWFCQPP